MRLMIVPAALSCLLLASCTSTSVSTGYYEVSGSTERQLDKSIASNGPMNGHAFAATQIQILPVTLQEKVSDQGCKVGKASFRVKAAITMPRWKNRTGASADLKKGFDIFADYARLHEQMHVRIGEAAAHALEKELLAIAPQKNCDRLVGKVKAKIKDVHARHHKAQLAFDAAENKRLKELFAAAAAKSRKQ